MGNLTGVQGGGSLPEQIQFVGASTVAGTKPAKTVPVVSPVSKAATFQTGGINRLGANVAMARLMCGAITGSGTFTVKVQHSNDDGVLDAYTDLAAGTQGHITGAAVVTATGAVGGAVPNTDTNLVTDLRQAKQWIRYNWNLDSGTSAIVGQAVVLGAYDTLPASDY